MGIINFGLPQKEALFLKELMELDVLVEGGTYEGGTAKQMSTFFKQVFTIEKSAIMHQKAQQNLADINNITLLLGDTREHLSSIIEKNDNILFWLDAHYSGGDTYGVDDECPLIEELTIIFQQADNCIILVDDARLFLSPPPLPHQWQNWPSIFDISKIIPKGWQVIVFEDVIYIYPEDFDNGIRQYIQKKVTADWNKPPSNIKKFIGIFKKIID